MCPDIRFVTFPLSYYNPQPSLTRGALVYPDHDMMSPNVRETTLRRLDGGDEMKPRRGEFLLILGRATKCCYTATRKLCSLQHHLPESAVWV